MWGGELVVRNTKLFEREAERLRSEHAGAWMAIAQAELFGPFDSFQEAVDAVEDRDPGTHHAYVFRPGVDDSDREVGVAPTVGAAVRNRVGSPLLDRADVELATGATGALLSRGERSLRLEGGGAPQLRIAVGPIAPFEDPTGFTSSGGHVDAVVSPALAEDLVLVSELAKACGARRYFAPGRATLAGGDGERLRRTWCRVRIAELEVEEVGLAVLVE